MESCHNQRPDELAALASDGSWGPRCPLEVPSSRIAVPTPTRVGQDNLLAVWPSVYPADTILDVFTYSGAPGAYNKNLGPGAGL